MAFAGWCGVVYGPEGPEENRDTLVLDAPPAAIHRFNLFLRPGAISTLSPSLSCYPAIPIHCENRVLKAENLPADLDPDLYSDHVPSTTKVDPQENQIESPRTVAGQRTQPTFVGLDVHRSAYQPENLDDRRKLGKYGVPSQFGPLPVISDTGGTKRPSRIVGLLV
jgi:hypothetical protein